MLGALLIIATLFASDVLDFYLTNYYAAPTLRIINSTYAYIAFPTLIIWFYHFVGGKRMYLPAWIINWINAAVYLISIFTGIAFTIDENNVFVRGPLGFTSHIICSLLLLNLLFLTHQKHKGRTKYYTVPLICLALSLLHGGSEEYCKESLSVALKISKKESLEAIEQLYCKPEYKARMKEIAATI